MTSTSFLTLALSVFLFSLSHQTLGSWGLGPLCGLLGAYRLQRHPGKTMVQTTWGAMMWSLPAVLVVFGLRVAAALTGVAILLNAPYMGWRYDIERFLRSAGILAWGMLGTLVLWWAIAPWVRAWYNTALGIWAASWASRRSERAWTALLGQLGFGLVAALIWLCVQSSGALAAVVYLDVWAYRRMGQYSFSSVSLIEGQAAFYTAMVITLGIGAYLAGQVLVPVLYLRLAKRRVSAQQPSEDSSPQALPDSATQAEWHHVAPKGANGSLDQSSDDIGAGSQP